MMRRKSYASKFIQPQTKPLEDSVDADEESPSPAKKSPVASPDKKSPTGKKSPTDKK